jgi:tetratricopeptide (TPR) repeat protein
MRFSIESNLAVALMDAGDLERAQVQMAYSSTLLGAAVMDLNRFNQANNRAELALAQDEFQTAEEAYREASTYLGLTTPSYAQDLITAGLGICALETGDLSEARRCELSLPEHPSSWYFDPTTILAFESRLLDRRGHTDEALGLLESSAADLQERLELAWLKVRALQVRLMVKRRRTGALALAVEGRDRAAYLRLDHRATEFERMLSVLG